MEVIIRDIEEKDFPLIFDLASDSVKYHVSPFRENVDMDVARENFVRDLEVVKENLSNRPNSRFIVAVSEEDRVLGYLLMATDVCESTTGVEQAWIFDMALWDDYWQSKVPQQLLDKAEAIARDKGLKYIAIQITLTHKKALDFLKSRGYGEERKRMYKKLPFEYRDMEEDRREILKALSGIKFKINFPV